MTTSSWGLQGNQLVSNRLSPGAERFRVGTNSAIDDGIGAVALGFR
jgi:hypothetical protein